LENTKVDEAVLEKLQFIESVDLTGVKSAAINMGSDPELVEIAELELRKFLALPLFVDFSAGEFAPSIVVDDLWHHFIVRTPEYRSFCEQVYGAYLDHIPDEGVGEEGDGNENHRRLLAERLPRTIEALRVRFGDLPEAVWAEPGWCGPCIPRPSRSPVRAS
jgi:hypothetical protein